MNKLYASWESVKLTDITLTWMYNFDNYALFDWKQSRLYPPHREEEVD